MQNIGINISKVVRFEVIRTVRIYSLSTRTVIIDLLNLKRNINYDIHLTPILKIKRYLSELETIQGVIERFDGYLNDLNNR